MFKYTIALLVFAFSVLPTVTPYAHAQDASTGTYNSTQGTTDNTAGTTTNDNRGFNWLWLLPLLAIPLFFVLRRDDDADDTAAYRDRGYAGMKGGRSRRTDDEEENLL